MSLPSDGVKAFQTWVTERTKKNARYVAYAGG